MATKDILRDFVLFNGADKQVGRIDSFKPPSLQIQEEDYRGSGMDAPVPLDMGMQALKASWTTSGIDRTTYEGFGLMNGLITTVIVRAAVVNALTGVASGIVYTMGGKISIVEPSELKVGERATLSATMSLVYYKKTHTIPGLPLTEIDVNNGIRIINGVDQLIALRALVGR